jgi:transcriptional regulator with PAS, ATPase and Fis domain
MYSDETRMKIREAREQFRRGLSVDESCVRREILESWRRSRAYGLDFDKGDKRLIPPEELRGRIEERRVLYDLAVPVMEQLYDFTTGSGFLSSLSDEEGYLLKTIGDEEIMAAALRNKFQEGCNRNERRLGTNGIGTALVTGRPIQVFAEEHYYELHQQWVCSGAPISDHEGRTVGVFCLTGLCGQVSFHTLGLAVSVANSISQQLVMRKAYDEIARIQHQTKAIIESVPSGILLLNQALKVIQMNSQAAALLMLPETRILGRRLHEIIGGHPLDAGTLYEALNDRSIAIERHGQVLRLMFSLNRADAENIVLTFARTESLHKKVHHIIGSEARFTFDDIVGQSPALRNAVSLARIAAGNESTVLLTGESGTGKELFAHSIHNAGPREKGPFIAINCAALPKSLVESELFGYESGSFTGARREGAAGKFELANGGTIFLDEIGDMPLDVQASLLRVLQNREVTRLGGSRAVKVDVRIIAATNRNLAAAVENGAFRDDLYYRLNVFGIHIPPLRERAGDIRLLADHFLRKYARFSARPAQGFSEDAYLALEEHVWRGNTRELENAVERVSYMARTPIISRECLHFYRPSPIPAGHVRGRSPEDPPVRAAGGVKDSAEAVERALAATRGNVRRAAGLLGVSRRTLYRRIARYGFDPASLRRRV